MFMSMIIGAVTKLISGFGLSALNSWTAHLKSKDIQYTKRWLAAAETQTEIVVAEMDYRLQLLGTTVGKVLIIMIVGPPALHWMLVWIDTMFLSFGVPMIGIEKAPPGYDELGRDIMLAFIGVKGALGIGNIIQKGLKK